MIWLIFSYLLYSINNVIWKWAAVKGNPVYLINRRSIFTSLVAFSVMIFTVVEPFVFVTQDEFIWLLLSCLLGNIGLFAMVTSLQKVSLRMFGYYTLLGIVINGYYSYFIQNQAISSEIVVESVLLLAGFLLFQWEENRRSTNKKETVKQHLLMLLMTVAFSLSGIISWNVIQTIEPIQMMATQEIFILITTSLLLLFGKKIDEEYVKPAFYLFPIFALVIGGAVFTGLIGLKINNPYIAAIGGVSVPLLTVMFGAIFFKERISITQIIAFVLVVSGVLLMV